MPVCAAKCAYCDFFSVDRSSLAASYPDRLVDATLKRAETLAERFASPGFKTLYIGGGTPTALGSATFSRLLEGIARIAPSPLEWTVEANPESLDYDRLESMLKHGVTRVSMGVQSLDNESLVILGRLHDRDEALRAARLAAESGLELSVDLIAGLPSRGSPRKAGSLAEAASELMSAGASHLSAYDLTLEEGTPLARKAKSLSFPNEDEQCEERSELESALSRAGFRRYEVSNYAPVGNECRHNLGYWHMDSYIGAGPGAVSTLVAEANRYARPGISGSSIRIEEPKDLDAYLGDPAPLASETRILPREAAFEAMMMAYRTIFGLDTAVFRSRFGMDAPSLIGATLEAWRERIRIGEPWPFRGESRNASLDGLGLDLLNRFLADCLTELEKTCKG